MARIVANLAGTRSKIVDPRLYDRVIRCGHYRKQNISKMELIQGD